MEANKRFQTACPDSSNPLLSEFFTNPRCPLTPAVIEAAATDVDLIEQAKDSKENASVRDQGWLCSPYLSLFFFWQLFVTSLSQRPFLRLDSWLVMHVALYACCISFPSFVGKMLYI